MIAIICRFLCNEKQQRKHRRPPFENTNTLTTEGQGSSYDEQSYGNMEIRSPAAAARARREARAAAAASSGFDYALLDEDDDAEDNGQRKRDSNGKAVVTGATLSIGNARAATSSQLATLR